MSGERVIIELKGADVIGERLDKMRMQDKMVKKQINFLVKKVMQAALKKTRAETRQKMKSDPRKAYQAVKMMVYKKIIGGNLNIFAPRKAGESKYADFIPGAAWHPDSEAETEGSEAKTPSAWTPTWVRTEASFCDGCSAERLTDGYRPASRAQRATVEG